MYRPARGEYMSVVSQTELHHDLQGGTLPPKKNEVRLLFLFLRVERPFCYILIQSRRAVGGGCSLSLFSPANGFIIAVTPLPETGPEEKSRETVQIGLKHELVSLESLLLLCGLQVRFSERDKALFS